MGEKPLDLRFVRSATDVSQLQAAVAEVAVVGRSNVGKSSLLNSLANRKQLARTSKTPGATQLINVFELAPVESGRWVVDLPGYGYAKVPQRERAKWQGMIEGYLTGRTTLRGVLLLIDGEVGPTKLDIETIEWLRHVHLAIYPIATKSDKVKSSKKADRKTDLAEGLGVPPQSVMWCSASKGIGVDAVRSEIRKVLLT